ncbi:Uncharacterised protein [Mycobacteroides abscessus subsp. massiliense]|nr:Uncharacterised protein [Mycobacteroides abscessus subsp. massiliense]
MDAAGRGGAVMPGSSRVPRQAGATWTRRAAAGRSCPAQAGCPGIVGTSIGAAHARSTGSRSGSTPGSFVQRNGLRE